MPDVTNITELKSAHPALVAQLEQISRAEGKQEGVTEERVRCTAIMRFGIALEVADSALEPIENGMGPADYSKHFEQARLEVLKTPPAPPVAPPAVGQAPAQPAGSATPTEFMQAVDELQTKYRLDTTQAMLRAEEQYPELHKVYLESQSPASKQIAS